MKHLANVQAQIFHRHFSEDSFDEIKRMKNIKMLKVVTYGAANSLYSTIKFIFEELASKGTEIEILYGVANFDSDQTENQIRNNLRWISQSKFKDIRLHLHSRSHIKAVSADGKLFLGSQNIATTSKNLLDISSLEPDELYSNHEIIIKMEDNDNYMMSSIFDNLTDDKFCYVFFDGNSCVDDIELGNLRYWYDYNEILNYIKDFNDVIGQYDSFIHTTGVSSEIEVEELHSILEVLENIFEASSTNSFIKLVNDLIDIRYSESYLDDSTLDKLSSLKEIVDDIIELNENSPAKFKSDSLDKIEELIQPPDLNSIDEDELDDIIDKVRSAISYGFATDKKSFLEHWEFEIVDYINSNPGDFDLYDLPVNESSRPDEEDIAVAVSREFISLDQQVSFLGPQIGMLAREVLEHVISKLVMIHEERVSEAYDILESSIFELRKKVERFNIS